MSDNATTIEVTINGRMGTGNPGDTILTVPR